MRSDREILERWKELKYESLTPEERVRLCELLDEMKAEGKRRNGRFI